MPIKPKLKIPDLKMETLAVHAGRRTDPATGAVTPPIHLSTTFERGPDGEYPLGFSYSREGNPMRQSLEECLASLEGGKEALAFSSGLAVARALLQGLEPGDHIVAPVDVYFGLRQGIGGVFAKWPLETTYVDMADLGAVQAAMRPNTRLVLTETPSNPLLQITDLAAVARVARTANAITVCDGTFTTPVLQRPLDCGIDMIWHSTTKYIGGHSDVTGGALVTRYDNYLFERARKSLMFGGAAPSPFDCWLALRGVSTLPWRMRALSKRPGDRGIPAEAPCCRTGALSRAARPSGARHRRTPPASVVRTASSSTVPRSKAAPQKRRKISCAPRLGWRTPMISSPTCNRRCAKRVVRNVSSCETAFGTQSKGKTVATILEKSFRG
ncbi:MAG TPA: aminotransferase class I/II-fold pyridoxal phosphate-dependent enzyme [Lacipirellulaceae bacterium]|nr:aminotransferase class I/II-fold pyridoxal phosphate-dependent enzyme [Lacipirellulaceae bacterium]